MVTTTIETTENMNDFNDFPEILNATQAAKLLGIKKDALHRLCRLRRLPAKRCGAGYRFSKTALLQWLSTIG